jgi:osmotically-inducible protein OsmY
MKISTILICTMATALAAPALAVAEAPDVDPSHGVQYVKDSAITAAVKTTLAADHVGSLATLKVNTDQDGVVWLSGAARTQEAADRAVEAARNVDGVMAVKSTIVVAPETR